MAKIRNKMNEWLERYGAKSSVIPGLFDLPELWAMNRSRFPGFNIIFFPLYGLFILFAIPYTSLCLVEAIAQWHAANKLPTRPPGSSAMP